MPSNNGAFPLRLPAMLGALYGALLLSTAHPCATRLLLRFIPPPQRHLVVVRLTDPAEVVGRFKPRSGGTDIAS
jgi:hypothetical protein